MRGKYKAAFLLPTETSRCLGEDGWEFNSENFIPETVKGFLGNMLGLEFLKIDIGISYYIGNTIQASMFHEENTGNIEHVFFQVYGGNMKILEQTFKASGLCDSTELFIPR